MMCPGISYSTVHSLIFHTNGSVQDNKLFTEFFCNRKQAHFASDGMTITDNMIDNETLTLMDQPELEKYKPWYSALTWEYEIITTFMKIHNIFATWEVDDYTYVSSSQLKAGSYWCQGGYLTWECCPPM